MKISIVIPCLNEAETIKACVLEAFEAIRLSGENGEVIIADNGSTDNSADIAEKNGARVVFESRKGYGSALMAGINAAQGQYILMGDADGSYDFRELPKFLNKLEQGNDLVMGCRLPRGGGCIAPGAMPWKHRWIGNPVLSFLGRLFFKAPVDDFHCGLRAFRRDSILGLDLKTPGMEFASEMVVKSCLAGLRIEQVPVTLRKDRRNRPPHLRSWRDGWRHLRFLLLYAPNWLFIYPGLILSSLGLFGFIMLWPGPVKIGSATLDLNTLLACSSATLVGFQVLSMGIFAKAYSISCELLPGNKLITAITGSRTAEIGTGAGIILTLLGIGVFLFSFLEWRSGGYGPLSIQESLRYSILGLTFMGLGVQVVASGFIIKLIAINND